MNSIEVLSIVVAIGFGVFSIVGVMISLFLWNRGESNTERRNFNHGLDSIRKRIERLERRK